ncbi:cytochrome P450 [Streptomyces sp. 378]|uniref:cytochrome P450 n=1 Tax=Streptomyces sp. 378 TaxID=3049412 RepID=UPI0024C2EEDA|nr:cytochrome P450 [Streptomyces sp. 378]MDK1349142.1 cytochrome P450 [Streptomyces sp. 378]
MRRLAGGTGGGRQRGHDDPDDGGGSRVLFTDSLDAAKAAEVRRCLAVVVRGLFVRTVVPVDALFRIPTPANRRYRHAVARLHAIVDAAVARRRSGEARDDLLGVLLAAADGAEPPVTDQEVHDQLVSLLLTGAESPSLCLASAFSLLARNPEAERRLHAEVDTVLADRRRPNADDLPRLVHTRAVIDETLRHSPPGWLFTRVATRDVEFGGRRLPRGTTVLYSPYLLHHSPTSFPDPERFRPERWLSENDADGPYSPMVPFAAGSRKCLGDTFAMAQMTVALATIARHWRLRHPPGPVAPPRPAVTLGPRSLMMICAPRTGAHRRRTYAPGDHFAGRTGNPGGRWQRCRPRMRRSPPPHRAEPPAPVSTTSSKVISTCPSPSPGIRTRQRCRQASGHGCARRGWRTNREVLRFPRCAGVAD